MVIPREGVERPPAEAFTEAFMAPFLVIPREGVERFPGPVRRPRAGTGP